MDVIPNMIGNSVDFWMDSVGFVDEQGENSADGDNYFSARCKGCGSGGKGGGPGGNCQGSCKGCKGGGGGGGGGKGGKGGKGR